MLAKIPTGLVILFVSGFLTLSSPAQTSPKTMGADVASSALAGLQLANKGRCKEALPILKKATTQTTDKKIKYDTTMATARCAMSLNQTRPAVEAILWLNAEFPQDPEVLYFTTHYYGMLASRASQQLAAVAPSSPQAYQLEAESYESQGKWEEAAVAYNKILTQNPKFPGIHYRLGRIYLSKSQEPQNSQEARSEFEQELQVDPNNASAEFMLGEMARQSGQWEQAIQHFSRASKLDEGFVEASLALGMSLNAAGKFAEAVPPLENYVKLMPGDPAGHYQLGTAYSRTGRKEDAANQMRLQREAAQKMPGGSSTPQQ